ncbi:MAG: MBL fold metallo-hydrolase [Synergistaceae bacterium]|jgi:glyoxylase-like metal-dependent hydrolase (beta-lactamase superfamily II)|nr:MBL fold metallo-hydrolase [Synergistaceae bacterium]
MAKEILPGVFQLDVPFSRHPLRGIHDYLFVGRERHLLVDTALNDDECEASLLSHLRDLGVRLEDTDIFLTHMHVDHSGLISRLKREANKVYASAVDRVYIDAFQSPNHWKWLTQTNVWCGVPDEHALKPEEHVAYSNRPSFSIPIQEVRPGDVLLCGGYEMEVTDLAGHTPGQVGLWHAETGSLFSGDHILNKITPNITTWTLDRDYLEMFCESLKRVKSMPVRCLYAAHGAPLPHLHGRIDELLKHHADRLAVMESLVREAGRPVPAFDVAKDVEWSRGEKFTEITIQQKWFACSETLAHLRRLVSQGKLYSRWVGGTLYFSKSEP